MRLIQFLHKRTTTIYTSYLPCMLSDAIDEFVFIVRIIKSMIFAWSILLPEGMHHWRWMEEKDANSFWFNCHQDILLSYVTGAEIKFLNSQWI
jgi:hypothetical protein